MKSVITICAVSLSLAAAPAFAKGAPDSVAGMVGLIGELGGNAAPSVSGKNNEAGVSGESGWGNNFGGSKGRAGAEASGGRGGANEEGGN